ncbi:MAG TPA: hypothetical protein VMV44_00750, partial [Rectinemataceae bacterium]|nr:hypothetical protein [Rectinemataceae bacterium]
MKKIFALLLAFAFVLGSFALDVAGLPLTVGAGLSGGLASSSMSMTILSSTNTLVNNTINYGFEAVVGLKYVQLGTGLQIAKFNGSSSTGGGTTTTTNASNAYQMFVPIQLLGMYPVAVGGITLVPMAGLEYDVCVANKDASGNDVTLTDTTGATVGLSYLSSLSAKLGVGAEFPLGDKLSIRPQVLASYGLYSAENSDVKKYVESLGATYGSY